MCALFFLQLGARRCSRDSALTSPASFQPLSDLQTISLEATGISELFFVLSLTALSSKLTVLSPFPFSPFRSARPSRRRLWPLPRYRRPISEIVALQTPGEGSERSVGFHFSSPDREVDPAVRSPSADRSPFPFFPLQQFTPDCSRLGLYCVDESLSSPLLYSNTKLLNPPSSTVASTRASARRRPGAVSRKGGEDCGAGGQLKAGPCTRMEQQDSRRGIYSPTPKGKADHLSAGELEPASEFRESLSRGAVSQA